MDKCNEEYHRNNEKCVCCRSKEMCDDIEKKNIKDKYGLSERHAERFLNMTFQRQFEWLINMDLI